MKKPIFDYSIDADEDTQRQFKECSSQDFVHAALTNPENERINNIENKIK